MGAMEPGGATEAVEAVGAVGPVKAVIMVSETVKGDEPDRGLPICNPSDASLDALGESEGREPVAHRLVMDRSTSGRWKGMLVLPFRRFGLGPVGADGDT